LSCPVDSTKEIDNSVNRIPLVLSQTPVIVH
jgi:hypothetical protein